MNIEPLRYKDDWPRAAERLLAWWRCELIDRACIQIRCPRPNGPPPLPGPADRHWMDADWQLDNAERTAQRTCYLGEHFPVYWPNIGPETLAAYLGCRVEFAPTTSWTRPLPVPPGRSFPELSFDPANEYYQWVKKVTLEAVERFRGRLIVGLTDIHGAGDTLAAIRDPQQLCLDLIERPDEVRRSMNFLRQFTRDRFKENVGWTISQGGTTTWLPCFSTGAYACTQTDFIVLVGPALFREFFLGDIERMNLDAEHVCYHLDGPDEIKHLDDLLAMRNLHAVQWVPPPADPQTRWIPLFKRIRAAGKGLHLSLKSPSEAAVLLEELGPEGLLLNVTMNSLDEANQLLRDVERLSARRGARTIHP